MKYLNSDPATALRLETLLIIPAPADRSGFPRLTPLSAGAGPAMRGEEAGDIVQSLACERGMSLTQLSRTGVL